MVEPQSDQSKPNTGFANSYAVVIGINDYRSGIPPLRTAVNDARTIAEILEKEHDYALISPPEPINQNKAWMDGDATLAHLNGLLKNLKARISKNDRLLFYFAGHGIALNSEDGPQGFLIPQDAKHGDTNTYLPMSQLRNALRELTCRHCLIILDCCYSGAFRWSNTRQFGHVRQIFKDNFDLFINDPAWQVITSSAHDQTAADEMVLKERDFGNAEHSPFASALMKALKDEGADTYPPAKDGKPAGDGIITADELYQYVRYQIELETAQHNKRQTPGLWIIDEKHDKGVYVFLTKQFDKQNLPDAPTLEDTEESNPYRGLKSYEEEHSQCFFGRTKQIEQLCDRVCEHPLTVVLGASGSGKSSLVKAGLIPHLKQSLEEEQQSQVLVSLQDNQTHCHKHKQWEILKPMRPGESPVKTLENILNTIDLGTLPTDTKLLLVIDQFEELVTQCRDQVEREQFLQKLSEQLKKYSGRLHLVLTLRSDFEPQLRERVETEFKKHQNLELLLNAQHPSQPIGIGSKQQPEKHIWDAARFIVQPMMREELQELIEAPAAVKAIQFDSKTLNNRSLVQQLIHEVADMPGALPLLSFALSELYRKLATRFIDALKRGETGDRTITWADYNELGGVAQSVTKKANEVYRSLLDNNPDEKDAYARTIRNIMLRMISVEGGEVARRKMTELEWTYADPNENKRVDNVINGFVSERLLVKYTIPDPQQSTGTNDIECVEPAHDALVRGWDKLQTWQQEEQEALPLQRRLTPAAIEWKSKEHSSDLLGKAEPALSWLDKKLDSAEAWLNQIKKDSQERQQERKGQFLWNSNPYLNVLKKRLKSYDYWFNQIETEFVQQSVWQRRRNVNLRWGLVVFGFLVLSGFTTWALIRQRDAEIGQIRTSRQASEALFLSNEELPALLSSIRAGKLFGNPLLQTFQPDDQLREQVIQTFRRIFYGMKERNRWEPMQEMEVRSMFFHPNGSFLTATINNDGIVQLWNIETREQPILQFSGHQFPNSNSSNGVFFSPDTSKIATIDSQGVIRLWDWNGNKLGRDFQAGYSIEELSFSFDGQLFVTKGYDNQADYQNMRETTRLWDVQGNNQTLGTNIVGFGFRSDGTLMSAYQDDNNGLVLLGLSSQPISVPNIIQRSSDEIRASFSQDENYVVLTQAYGGGDGSTKMWHWNGSTLEEVVVSDIDKIDEAHIDRAQLASFSSDSKLVAFAENSTVRIYNLSAYGKSALASFSEIKLPSGTIQGMIFSQDGKELATLDEYGNVRLWDVHTPQLNESKRYQFWKEGIQNISFSSDLKSIVAVDNDGTTIRVFNSNGRQFLEFSAISSKVTSISFSPDGKIIATGSDNGTVSLFRLNGERLGVIGAHSKNITSVVFSSDGQRLATLGSNEGSDGADTYLAKLWRLNNDKLELEKISLEIPSGFTAHGVSFQQSNELKVIAEDTFTGATIPTVSWWNMSGKRQDILSGELKSEQSEVIALSHDGNLLASVSRANRNIIKLWDLQNKRLLTEFQGSECNIEADKCIASMVFSPDGSTLAVIGSDGNAKFWQLGTFDDLLAESCERMRDYISSLNGSDRHLCDGIN